MQNKIFVITKKSTKNIRAKNYDKII